MDITSRFDRKDYNGTQHRYLSEYYVYFIQLILTQQHALKNILKIFNVQY